eukprot:scaffold261200_cov22-Prasinocladus_malaysianus.AAC.1
MLSQAPTCRWAAANNSEATKDGPTQRLGNCEAKFVEPFNAYGHLTGWLRRPDIGVKQVQEPEPASQPAATSVAAAPTTAAAGKARKKGAVIGSAPKLNPEGLLAKYQAEKAAKAALLAKAAKTTAARPQGPAAASAASAVSNIGACTHHECANIWQSQAGHALARASGRVIMAA